MRKILEGKDISKVYKDGKGKDVNVLTNINISIDKGEFVTVMGASGSGKSTLLYTISGMDKITSGSVSFQGREISLMTEDDLAKIRLKHMGFIFQQNNLLKNLSIIDNIILPAYQAKIENRKEINKKALNLMRKIGIESIKDSDITEVSGGQLQRASICRSLINNPGILFGDEPTGALNSSATNEVMDTIRNINEEGTTVLIVTHDMKVAAQSERVIFMLDGKIIDEKVLGKYKSNIEDLRYRENELSTWLSIKGF